MSDPVSGTARLEGQDMRGMLLVFVQLVVSLFVVGALLPALLFAVPAARSARTGLVLAAALVAGMFLILRIVWPASRRE